MIPIILLIFMMNSTNQPIKFNFNQLDKNQLMIVNDSVMGGKSLSNFEINEQSVQFSGNVSLKNNGGFASLRMLWPFKEAKGFDKIQIKLKGDGRSYQFRLRTNLGFDGAAYVYEFKTTKDESMVIEANVTEFIPSFRGRILKDMPELLLEDVKQMGILIADKQEGDFNIEIKSITLLNQ